MRPAQFCNAFLAIWLVVLSWGCDDPHNTRPIVERHGAGLDEAAISASADTYVRSGNPNQPAGTAQVLRIQASGDNRALVRFDQDAIEGALGSRTLVAATLELTVSKNGGNWGTNGRTVDAHRVTHDWQETRATWSCSDDAAPDNSQANCSGPTAWEMGGSGPTPWNPAPVGTLNITNSTNEMVAFDVTADVLAFIAGTAPNYGWILKKTDEGLAGLIELASRETATPPRLVLVAEDPDAGPPSGSVELSGEPESWVMTQDTAALSVTHDLTLEMWARTASIGTPSYPSRMLLSKWISGGVEILPRSYIAAFRWEGGQESQGQIEFSASDDGLHGVFVGSAITPNMTIGTWHHVALVYRAAEREVSFYFDGAPLGTAGGLPPSLLDGSAPLIVGGNMDVASVEPTRWHGRIAEARVWNVARTASEIADNRAVRLAPQPGLVGYWPLGDGTDVSGFGQHMSISGDATFVSDTPF